MKVTLTIESSTAPDLEPISHIQMAYAMQIRDVLEKLYGGAILKVDRMDIGVQINPFSPKFDEPYDFPDNPVFTEKLAKILVDGCNLTTGEAYRWNVEHPPVWYNNLPDAIDAAGVGDKILLKPGTHNLGTIARHDGKWLIVKPEKETNP